jgi:leucyl-tRNA synthetase
MSEQTKAADASNAASVGAQFRYDAQLAGQIEVRWQDRWERAGTFHSPNPSGSLAAGFERVADLPKAYVLDMFAAPSGTGIHVGHPLGYIATDVYARFLRMTGHHVLHAMGFDSFGLPAEQYALETGQHPRETTEQNVASMREQLRRLGLGHDRRRSVLTSDPAFYRWTQWIFLQIYNSWVDEETGRARPVSELADEYATGRRLVPGGRPWAELSANERAALIDDRRLAYVAEELVNWCPGLGTVLANEEVTADGRSDIGNFPVYRRPLRQWMMRITAMAQRLIDDLDALDWPEPIKQLQRNWIGPSAGADICLPVAGASDAGGPDADASCASSPDAGPGDGGPDDGGPDAITVFTTRPDTLADATYVVLAPEHPLAARLVTATWPAGTKDRWRYPAGAENARGSATTEQAGRGWQPTQAVATYRAAASRLSDRERAGSGRAKTGVFTGSYAINPANGERLPVFVADYVLMAHGTGAIMGVPGHDERDRDFAAEYGLPVSAVTDAGQDIATAVDAAIDWLERNRHGHAARRYRLRDWLFSRQRYWGEPFPIVYDEHGSAVALPDDALPVLLPEMSDFRPDVDQDPASQPVPPLARAHEWAALTLDLGDGPRSYRRELNTMPQWAGSCWYYLRYLDPANGDAFVDPDVERYWMAAPDGGDRGGPDGGGPDGSGGVDLYVGGVEHAVLHLLYARFWHKVLFDLGLVSTREPFRRLVNNGYILADAFTDDRGMHVPAAEVTRRADGSAFYRGRPVTRRSGKMGKSLKNGISPDEIFRQYGADTLRLYEMASGPLEASRPWQPGDIIGVHRFLQRLWRCLVDEQTGELTVSDAPLDPAARRAMHGVIADVRQGLGRLRFNTAIARLMELATIAARISARDGALPRELAEPLVLMVAPFAPHIAEELWSRLGHSESLAYGAFPQADDALVRAQTVTMPVQVNGRTRFQIQVAADAPAGEIERILISEPEYALYASRGKVERLVVVPGRIVNIVVR